MEVNVHAAKTNLCQLLRKVAAGEEVTISRAGVPVARLIAIPQTGPRPMGMDEGKIWIAEDFDAPDPALEALFHAAIPDVDFSREPVLRPKTASLRKRPRKSAGITSSTRTYGFGVCGIPRRSPALPGSG